jgi:hypothetical protein
MRHSAWATWGLAAATLALSTSGCRRATETAARDEQAGASAEASELQGVVSERRADELRVSDMSGQQHTVRADERTQVFVGGQPAGGLAEVQEGAEVRASFPGGDMSQPAVRIDVVTPGEKGQPSPDQKATPSTPR